MAAGGLIAVQLPVGSVLVGRLVGVVEHLEAKEPRRWCWKQP